MPHVFISHSSEQATLAEHVVRFLERKSIKCWLAPRDILAAVDFDQAIVAAIKNCSAIILLFSEKADDSTHVRRELSLADTLKKSVLTLRIEDVAPKKLAYWLNLGQWIDWLDRNDETLEEVAALMQDQEGKLKNKLEQGEGLFASADHKNHSERVVDCARPGGAQLFSSQRTIETAVYLGPPGGGKVGKALFAMMGSPRKVNKTGLDIRNIDWDGHIMVRPCDVHLGADGWDMRGGHHKFNTTFSDESFATLYSILFCDGVIFGNGRTILFKDRYGKILPIDGECELNSFVVTRDRSRIAWLDPNNRTLRYITKNGHDSFCQKSISLPPCFKRGYYTLLYCNPHNRADHGIICFEGAPIPNMPGELFAIARIDLEAGQFTDSCELPGLQSIALSSDGQVLLAISSEYLFRLNRQSLEVIDKIRIDRVRESELYAFPPIQFSPCGRYLAHSVAKSGEIEIFESGTLRPLGRLKTGGLPGSVFSWSCDGRFLASSVRPRSGGAVRLLIWDVENWVLACDIGSIKQGDSCSLYSNRQGSFAWHENLNHFVVLMSNGDVVLYVQQSS